MMYEYKIVEVAIDDATIVIGHSKKEMINQLAEDTINEYAKKGWRLHASGITTFPTLVFIRERKK